MYYLKDTETEEIKEYKTLASIQREFGFRGLVDKRDVRLKRLIKGRWILSDSLNFDKPKKICGKRLIKEFIVYIGDDVKEFTCTRHDLAEMLNIDYHSIRNYTNKGKRCGGLYYIYHKGNEIVHLMPKVKEEKVRKFYVLDLVFKNVTTKFTTLSKMAKIFNIKPTTLRTYISSKDMVNSRYYINYDNNFSMPNTKKKNPKDKKPKPDMNVNGDFIRKEPNKQAVRKGKLGVDAIKERLKKK